MSDFHNDTRRTDGKYPNCKECHYFYMRERHKREDVRTKSVERRRFLRKTSKKFNDEAKQRSQKFYESLTGRAKTLFKGVKRRQPDATATLERIQEMLEIGHCQVTGIKFDMSSGIRQTGKNYNPYAPSVDKIVPSLGYTNENIRLVIWQYNAMKGEQTDELIFEICRKLAERYPG